MASSDQLGFFKINILNSTRYLVNSNQILIKQKLTCFTSKILYLFGKNIIMMNKKYQRPVLADILDNITKIIEDNNSSPLINCFNYLISEEQYVEKYRKQIQPNLKTLMQKVKQSERIDMKPSNQPCNDLSEKINLYECVIAQMSRSHSKEYREKLQKNYKENEHKLTNQTTKSCLCAIIRASKILNDYQLSKQQVIQIQNQFKKDINLDFNASLTNSLRQIKEFLKAQQINKQALLEQLNSTSLLLNYCTQSFPKKAQIRDYELLLANIKIQIVNQPLFSLIKTLNLQIQSKKDRIQTGTSTDYIYFKTIHESLELMQNLPQFICMIEDFVNSNKIKYQQLTQDYLVKLGNRLREKIKKYYQKKQKLKNVSEQLALAQIQSQQNQKRIRQLIKRIDFLKRQLQKKEKQVQILKIKQISSKPQQDFCQLQQVKILRQNYDKLSRQKNELLTEFHNLQHQLNDERAEFKQKLSQELDRLTKFLLNQKAKQIAKIDEKRRAQKSKLMAERQEMQNQLILLKEKYFNEVGAMLNRSRMDMSICKSDKGVGNSILQVSNILNDLEQENQQDIDFSVNELQNQFKKQFQQEILKLNKKNTVLQAQLDMRQNQIKQLEIKMKQSSLQIQQLKNQIERNIQRISSMIIQINMSKSKIKELRSINKNYLTALNKESKNDSNALKLVSYEKMLFQGVIFDEDDQSKAILIKHITNYTGKTILKSRFLYEYNPNNKTNFHSCIDNKKGILCVVKTYQTIIAGFYPGALIESVNMNQGGLLISVSNDRSYPLMQNKNDNSKVNYRGMTYDSYYVIFGNAQMRIRTGENKVFSNYGIQNSYFDYQNSSRNVNEFLGEGDNRQVQYINCEFYQVFFEESVIENENQSIFKTF